MSKAKRSDLPYGHASMLLLGEGSEATEPYNKYDKIRPQSIRSLQFDHKVRPLSFRPENFDLFTATPRNRGYYSLCPADSQSVNIRRNEIEQAIHEIWQEARPQGCPISES